MTEETTQQAQTEKKEDKTFTIKIKKDHMWKYSTFVLAAIVLVGAIAIFAGGDGTPTGAVVGADQPSPGAVPSAQVNVEVTEDDNFLQGSPDSEFIIVEYTDYECPFCARANGDALRLIKDTYTGEQVGLVVRDFPLTSIHPNAQKAAEASECAAEQGKFIEMHDMLFESGVSGGVPAFKGYATTLGLDTAQFNECLDSDKYASEVSADLQSGQSVGVRGTPGFVVGDQLVSGAQPFPVFDQLIKAGLA